MKFLIDTNPPKIEKWIEEAPDFVAGQLIVPASTRKNWGGTFGLDNSAFVRFDAKKFARLQKNQQEWKESCLFVTCPDVPGDARRTLEIWRHRDMFSEEFDLSLVLQNGRDSRCVHWGKRPLEGKPGLLGFSSDGKNPQETRPLRKSQPDKKIFAVLRSGGRHLRWILNRNPRQ